VPVALSATCLGVSICYFLVIISLKPFERMLFIIMPTSVSCLVWWLTGCAPLCVSIAQYFMWCNRRWEFANRMELLSSVTICLNYVLAILYDALHCIQIYLMYVLWTDEYEKDWQKQAIVILVLPLESCFWLST
jgi:hypothetical protein